MRIEESTTVATMRPMYSIEIARSPVGNRNQSAASNTGGSMSDSSANTRQAAPTTDRRRSAGTRTAVASEIAVHEAVSAAQLMAQPRFAAVVDLMERLTGREITLLPPATLVFGERTQPTSLHEEVPASRSANTQVTAVRPIEGGETFRIDTAATGGRGVESAHVDVGMDVIRAHADRSGSRPGPLRVHVSPDAAVSPPSGALRIENRSADSVRVTSARALLDQQA